MRGHRHPPIPANENRLPGRVVRRANTAVAQSHLKEILNYLEVDVLGQPELYLGPAKDLFDESGNVKTDETKKILASALETLAARVKKMKG